MAASQPSYATGVDRQDEELRRRNLQSNQQYNAGWQPQDLKEKSKEKVCIHYICFYEGFKFLWELMQEMQKPRSLLDQLDEYEWIIAPLVFTALAFFTRMWKIGLSPIVTWDEAQ